MIKQTRQRLNELIFDIQESLYILFDDEKNGSFLRDGILSKINEGGDDTRILIEWFFSEYKSFCSEQLLPLMVKIKSEDNLPNLTKCHSIFNNSSIWFRIINVADEKYKEKEENAKEDFHYFSEIGLYQYLSSKEYFKYSQRIYKENFLESESGKTDHAKFVVPMLYGDETTFRNNELLAKRKVERPHESIVKFNSFYDVALRILVIDDKVSICNQEIIKEPTDDCWLIDCIKCDKNCDNNQCKLKTLSSLLSKSVPVDRIGCDENEKLILCDSYYWEEHGIERYHCPSITPDFISSDYFDYEHMEVVEKSYKQGTVNNKSIKKVIVDFQPSKCIEGHVQIVGVRDVRTALLLMSKFKFDMVFCDYLLDYKKGDPGRDYATQLFEFLANERINKGEKKELKALKEEEKKTHNTGGTLDEKKMERLKELNRRNLQETFRHDVLDNRGPLEKLWVMPITGFNQTFIQDLHRNQISLIGHKWNISNGADPITTPWQFLYHLNKFIELQLKLCVYRMDQLLRFVCYECDDIIELNKKRKKELHFHDFQAFMGSEYASFMLLYGNRQMIQRDAEMENDGIDADKSVFATYVWKHFYINPEYRDVIELNRLIRRFLHHASVMHNDGNGQQRLEETFGQLSFFIDTNKKVQDTIRDFEDLKGLGEKMMSLRKIIDRVTDHSDNKKD